MTTYKSEKQNFAIIYTKEDKHIEGKCYSTISWSKATGETGWGYASGSEGGVIHDELNSDSRCLFQFSIVWRGCYDSRIYFTDDEYFGEELEYMDKFWKEIENKLREEIGEKE